MGKYGQAILTIGGTIIGAYFGYPALGAALGSLAGSLIFPTQLPTVTGPRLSDLAQTSASVGAPIPEGWGTFPVPGCVIAQTDLREVIESEEVGGKGGPSQTVETPTYFQDFAIGLCEGEDPINGRGPIGGVRTIWANGKPILDRRPQRDGESDADFKKRIVASDKLAESMVVYLGTEDQEPDPTLEAFFGVGNISAFRGLAYVMFINWQNKTEDGNRMPAQWKFEVYYQGDSTDSDASNYSNEVLYHWSSGADPVNPANHNVFDSYTTGVGGADSFLSDTTFDSLGEALSDLAYARNQYINGGGRSYGYYLGAKIVGTDAPPDLGGPGYTTDRHRLLLHYSSFAADDVMPAGLSLCDIPITGKPFRQPTPGTDTGAIWGVVGDYTGVGNVPGCDTQVYCFPTQVCMSWDGMVAVERVPRPPPDACVAGTPIPGLSDWAVLGGEIVSCGAWEHQDIMNCLVLAKYHTEGPGGDVDQYPLNPAVPPGHPRYFDEQFWTDAYLREVARGRMPAGMVYHAGGGPFTNQYPKLQNFIYKRATTLETLETAPALVSDIVTQLCREAGYDVSDVDVSDLAGLTVIGYVRTRVMTGRAAIDPLRQACFFDGFESDGKLKFRKRGHAVVRTFEDEELGYCASGDDTPSRITTRMVQETDLPRTVRLHYLSQSRDYEPGEQASPTRVETDATNDQDIELSIVLDDGDAAKIASVLWSDAWASRWLHEIQVDAGLQELEPTDPIAVPVDGQVQRTRILDVVDVLPAYRKASLVRDDDGSYVSYAAESEVPVVVPPLTFFGPIEAVYLDIPLLRDEDDDAGFYAAMRPLIEGAFHGGAIYRSIDGGGNYTRIGQAGNAATMGVLSSALDSGPTDVWDDESILYVELDYGSLESRTVQAVLNGANAAAVGDDGRWEIVQFRSAEFVALNLWKLTGLLRGRRGTEHFVGTSEAGDRFVLLSGSGIIRLSLPLSGVGREYTYKAVGTGVMIDAAEEEAFTGRGVALKPFSPVHVEGSRDTTTGEWTIAWVRRGRIGQTMQSGTDIPLSEEVEDYEVDVLDGDGTVVRTISTSVQSAGYLGTQQIADFGSVQTSITVRVYQLSTSVGRGTGTEATL